MLRVFDGYQDVRFHHMLREGGATVPRNYCLNISPLHAKVVIITGTSAKRRLTWGNGRDAKRGLAEVGLHAEQMSPNKPRGQMLVMNF